MSANFKNVPDIAATGTPAELEHHFGSVPKAGDTFDLVCHRVEQLPDGKARVIWRYVRRGS